MTQKRTIPVLVMETMCISLKEYLELYAFKLSCEQHINFCLQILPVSAFITVCPTILQAAYKEFLVGSLKDKPSAWRISLSPWQAQFSVSRHQAVHNTPKAVRRSTAVADTPEVVNISSEQYAVEGFTSAWLLVSNDVKDKPPQACITTMAFEENA